MNTIELTKSQYMAAMEMLKEAVIQYPPPAAPYRRAV
jgi:hypothetical protein